MNETTNYECVLVNKDGAQEQLFYREGKSASDVLNGLGMFVWPEGEWIISAVEDEY